MFLEDVTLVVQEASFVLKTCGRFQVFNLSGIIRVFVLNMQVISPATNWWGVGAP